MFGAVVGGRRGERQGSPKIWRRPMPAGLLAVLHTASTERVVAVANGVAETDVAVVARHMLTDHGNSGTETCQLPICDAVLRWRPSVATAEGDEATA